MNTPVLQLYLFLFTSLPFSGSAQQNTHDKAFLLNYFNTTTQDLENELDGLSPEQMHYTPSDEKWSVSQCAEHIVLTEKMLFDLAKAEMEKPANPERKDEVKFKDEDLISGMEDRSQKAQASPDLIGRGTYDTPEEAIAALMEQRQVILDYIEKTPTEYLRNHISDSPFGPVDTYQSLLFTAGHTARHRLQIAEIKASEGFPKD